MTQTFIKCAENVQVKNNIQLEGWNAVIVTNARELDAALTNSLTTDLPAFKLLIHTHHKIHNRVNFNASGLPT